MGVRKIIISIGEQKARIFEDEKQIKVFPISSAKNGTGYEFGSNTTPLGRFKIHKKIGEGAKEGTVFKARVPTGEICVAGSSLEQSPEDLVLSRILWLEGDEELNANTLERYIYLHGTNQEHLIGTPASHGCIRLTNKDILEVFDLVDEGTEVLILA